MFETLLQMTGVAALGVLWKYLQPGGVDALSVRHALTNLVYYLLLPALVFQVMSQTPVNSDSARISFVAATSVLASMAFAWAVCRSCRFPASTTGAVLLAAAFPNATYLGLPVLEATLGTSGRSIAIQYDLFACTPLLLTVGILAASRYGNGAQKQSMFMRLLRIPALQALVLAILAQQFSFRPPDVIDTILDQLADIVVPLMLFSLGLSLEWSKLGRKNWSAISMVSLIQLVLMPALVFGLTAAVGLTGITRVGVVLEAAMPAMVLGIVICDHYDLDTGIYAGAVTVSTLLALLTLPLWFSWVA